MAARILIWSGLLAFTVGADEVRNTVKATAQSGIDIVAGELMLPGDALWQLTSTAPTEHIRQLELRVPPEAQKGLHGRRMALAKQHRLLNRGRGRILQLTWLCRNRAKDHDGHGPKDFADLADDDVEFLESMGKSPDDDEFPKSLRNSPYPGYDDAEGPHYFLVPGVRYPTDETPGREAMVQMIELRPLLDDGKHWVGTTRRNAERVDIDQELVANYGLQIRPLLPQATLYEPPRPLTYRLYGQLQTPGTARFTVQDSMGDRTVSCTWDLSSIAPADEPEGIVHDWSRLRVARWRTLIADTDAPILRHWAALHQVLYQGQTKLLEGVRNSAGRDTTIFNLLGGRAAMRETLQLQALALPPDAEAGDSVPISDIAGVEVKSHPFAEMLGNRTGGTLPLADYVPADRAFVYAKPAAILPFLARGADFLAQLGATTSSRAVDYGLRDRYVQKLGLNTAWLEQFLKSGVVTELGFFAPDLFLFEGTDITCIVRIEQLSALRPLLRLIGVGDLDDAAVTAVQTVTGDTAYWAVRDDLLLLSTSRSELDAAVALGPKTGGSLAESAELRYMLIQQPLQPNTRAYVYFSDPFIRHLVGPACKIGQLRRLRTKAALQFVAAATLLHELDGHADEPVMDRLRRLGYLPADLPVHDITLQGGVPVSREYGAVKNLATLSARPVSVATTAEKKAYAQYVTAYRRYWRRFFDPIALRLDDTPDGGLALHTFILPLLDNSLYNNLRELIPNTHEAPGLRVPRVDPPPVGLLSFSLREEAWQNWLRDLTRRAGTDVGDTRVMDSLGPGLHIALHDGDPILASGSSDSLGMLGRIGRGNQWLMLPLFISALTRPCSLYIETSDPDGCREFLARGALQRFLGSSWLQTNVSYYQLTGQDRWVYEIDLQSMVQLHFGFAVSDRYVVVTNLPWSNQPTVLQSQAGLLSGAQLSLEPQAVEQQLAALYTAAAGAQRRSAMEGVGDLYPLFAIGVRDSAAAAGRHAELMGFAPIHPSGGEWRWQDGRVVSTTFGYHDRQRQPAHRAGDREFGLLQKVARLRVAAQLEDTGLRTVIRWHYTP